MKKLIILSLISMGIFACAKPGGERPTDLLGLKALLKSKNAERKDIESEIKSIKADILILEPPVEVEAVPVTTLALEKGDFRRQTTVQANAISDEIVFASSEIGGRILRLYVRENDLVKRGQLLAETDVVTIEKQLEEIKTSLDLADNIFERQKRLWEKNIGSEIQFLEAKNNKERLENSIETIKSQMSKSRIYAPISGVIEMELLKQGEMASPGMPIVQILNTSKIKFEADVPENYLASISKGDKVKLYLPALDLEMEERVSSVGRTIDPANRTFKVNVEVANKNGLLKPNLLGELSFVDYQVSDVISVPVNLVQEEISGDKYLFVVEEQDTVSRARKVVIKTTESNGNEIIVTEGLLGNETIIYDGYRTVTDGRKLIVSEAQSK